MTSRMYRKKQGQGRNKATHTHCSENNLLTQLLIHRYMYEDTKIHTNSQLSYPYITRKYKDQVRVATEAHASVVLKKTYDNKKNIYTQ